MIGRGTLIVRGTLVEETVIMHFMVVHDTILAEISIITGKTLIIMGQDIQTMGALIIHSH